MHKLIYALLLTAICGKGTAQTYQPATFTDENRLEKIEAAYPVIDRIYKNYAAKNHFPAMVYGIIVDGKLVHTASYGYTDVKAKTPATSKSEFRIASMTKSLTAMAILKLRDEGKLKLDDPAWRYIPEMKNIHYLTKDAAPITIRHLLTHSAGFPEDNPWGDRQLAVSDDKLLELYKKGISFSNNPGMGYEYSNLGFATLGYIIKKVSGKTYEQYITDNILQPLGMTNTYWEYTKVPKEQLAHGYRWLDDNWVEQPLLHDGAYGAMGGLITSIEDFSKYIAIHMNAWPARDDKETSPVKRSSIREMQYPWDVNNFNIGGVCPSVTAYAYGLRWAKDCAARTFIGHTGGLPGFGSNWNILTDYGIGVVSFANLTYARAAAVNSIALDSLMAISGIKPRALPSSDILERCKNELLTVIADWSKAKESGIFADNFFLDYFPERLKIATAETFAEVGNTFDVSKVVPENQLRGYFTIKGEKANIKVSFTLTPENPPLIQEYHMEVVR